MIASREGIDNVTFQQRLDLCIADGNDLHSPILRLMHKIAPELLDDRELASRWFCRLNLKNKKGDRITCKISANS